MIGDQSLFEQYGPLIAEIKRSAWENLLVVKSESSIKRFQNRINEISFNASLLGELRAINFVRRLIDEGRIEAGRMKAVRVHMISDDTLMNELTATSKLSPSPYLLERLKLAGRAAAQAFLDDGAQGIGSCGIDIHDLLHHG